MNPDHLVVERGGMLKNGAYRGVNRFLLRCQCRFSLIYRLDTRKYSFFRLTKGHWLKAGGDPDVGVIERVGVFAETKIEQSSQVVNHFIYMPFTITS